MSTCANPECAAPLAPSRGNRPRKWCSEACRRTQYAGTCVDCGGPTDGSEGRARAPERCASCAHDFLYAERNARIFRWWEEGVHTSLIAAREGMTETAVQSLVNTHRLRNGVPLPLRRRRNRELWPLIERRWREGASVREIAVEAETTRENIHMMIQVMRRAGFDLPYHSERAA